MPKFKTLSFLLPAVAIMALTGCERKIVNEAAPPQDGLAASACFTCHGDQDLTLVAAQQQWQNSKHGSGETINRNRNNSSRYQACERCHTSEGFIAQVSGVPADGEHFTSISCFTCHQPHTNGNMELRAASPVTLANGVIFDYGDGNLCANCHQSRANVDTYVVDDVELSERWGPHHSDQSDILAGTGGYEYAGYQYFSSAHTGVLEDGCIDCHMGGSQANLVGGHTWNMRSESEEDELQLLSGCNVDGCHGSRGPVTDLNRTAAADFDDDGTVEGVQDEIAGLQEELLTLLVAAELMEGDEEDGYYPAEDRMVSDADSAGAVYNYMMIAEERSGGIHNTQYAVGLLQSAINYLNTGSPNGVAPRERTQLLSMH
jgi:hypothetical protein